jgi:hypothetical protein
MDWVGILNYVATSKFWSSSSVASHSSSKSELEMNNSFLGRFSSDAKIPVMNLRRPAYSAREILQTKTVGLVQD